MLVAFPVGLWIFSLACDIIFRAAGNPVWATVAQFSMGGGIVGAIAAALAGFVDLMGMKESEAKRIGMAHAILNVSALLIFVADFSVRVSTGPGNVPFIMSILGVIVIMVSGWLGGSMVYLHGTAVDLEPTAGEPPKQQPQQPWKKAA